MEAQNYNVEFDNFCDRHYVKSFAKKYKSTWPGTMQAIEDVSKRIDAMLDYDRADLIASNGQFKLVKLDFSVEGTRISPKSSGNRCILVIDEDIRSVRILIVYSKNDISSPNETSKWKTIIKDQFTELGILFSI
jgi:hypothetical protein